MPIEKNDFVPKTPEEGGEFIAKMFETRSELAEAVSKELVEVKYERDSAGKITSFKVFDKDGKTLLYFEDIDALSRIFGGGKN